MFKLSIFAFIFAFLVLSAFIIFCAKEKRFSLMLIISAIITLTVIIGVGILTLDYAHGAETAVTIINIDDKNASQRPRLLMFFSDEQENSYWGVGSISSKYYGDDVPVRITYLPKTRFVLGIEIYVGDIPNIPILGIENENKEYIQIYSNGDSWSVFCVDALIFIVIFSIPKGKLKFFS